MSENAEMCVVEVLSACKHGTMQCQMQQCMSAVPALLWQDWGGDKRIPGRLASLVYAEVGGKEG